MNAIEFDAEILTVPWRVGGQVGRTIYAHLPGHPPEKGVLIVTMDHAEAAQHIVHLHNTMLLGNAMIAKAYGG
jgi:hypothetical protein